MRKKIALILALYCTCIFIFTACATDGNNDMNDTGRGQNQTGMTNDIGTTGVGTTGGGTSGNGMTGGGATQ